MFSDYDVCLLEQARCFFHLSHVYHAEGMHKHSFMAALQQLNSAERIGDNFHEVGKVWTHLEVNCDSSCIQHVYTSCRPRI